MTDDELFREYLIRNGCPEDVDIEKYADLRDTTSFALYRLAVTRNQIAESIGISAKEFADRLSAIMRDMGTEIGVKLSDLFDKETKTLYRPPVEIKRDIKHEKNPMRLKQLNQELNESYKAYRKRGK